MPLRFVLMADTLAQKAHFLGYWHCVWQARWSHLRTRAVICTDDGRRSTGAVICAVVFYWETLVLYNYMDTKKEASSEDASCLAGV